MTMTITLTHKLNGRTITTTTHRVSCGTGLVRVINATRQSGTHTGMRLSSNVRSLPGVSELQDGAVQLPTGSIYLTA